MPISREQKDCEYPEDEDSDSDSDMSSGSGSDSYWGGSNIGTCFLEQHTKSDLTSSPFIQTATSTPPVRATIPLA